MKFLQSHLTAAGISIILTSAALLFGVGLIGTSAYLISYAALMPSIAVLQVAIVGVRFFGLAKSGFRYLERLASHSVNFKMLTQLRSWLFRQISNRFPDRIQLDGYAGLLSRLLEDVETLELFFIRVINPPLAAILTGLIVAILFHGFHSQLAYTFLVLFGFSFLISLGISYLVARNATRGMIDARSRLHTKVTEYIQGMADLFVNQTADQKYTSIQEAERNYGRLQLKGAFSTGISNALLTLLTNASQVIMLCGGILLVNNGELDGKLLAACALITVAAFDGIQPLPLAAQQLVLCEQAGRRVLEIAGTQARKPAEKIEPIVEAIIEDDITHPMVQLENVSFSYPDSGQMQLKDVSFIVQTGQWMPFVGPSGAGKSTLAKLLLGYWPCCQGKMLLGHINYKEFKPEQIRSQVAYSGQKAYFFNDTLRENLMLANPAARQDTMSWALDICLLKEWLQKLPDQLDTQLGEIGSKISAGERRRLDIARAILRNSRILILDEPLAGLDAETGWNLMTSLRQNLAGRSVLWISHHLTGLQDFSEIMVMNHGRIVERGSGQELLMKDGLFRKMWEYQHQIVE